jgi:hypothetical protein
VIVPSPALSNSFRDDDEWLDSSRTNSRATTSFAATSCQGTRLFPDAGLDMALDLVDSRTYPKGITLQVYRPGGRPQYATDVPTPGR